jgi:uncharacterized protein (TIGR02246 family)
MKNVMWVAAVVLMTTVSSAFASEPPANQAAEVAGAKAVAAAFTDDWNRHDMKSFGDLFAEDAEFVNVIGMWWHGRTEIQKQHEALHATRMRNSHLVATESTVQPVRPDVAIVHLAWQLTGDTGIDGVTMPMRQGVLSIVTVRTGHKWQIAFAQNTDVVPLPNVPGQ